MDNVNAERYSVYTAATVGTNAVTPFTAYSSLTVALLTFEGSAVRFRIDGGTAHSSSGHLASAGVALVVNGSDPITKLSFLCTNTTGTVYSTLGIR